MLRLNPSAIDYAILAGYFVVVLGIGFVLSFEYWTTNFAEVQGRCRRATCQRRVARR